MDEKKNLVQVQQHHQHSQLRAFSDGILPTYFRTGRSVVRASIGSRFSAGRRCVRGEIVGSLKGVKGREKSEPRSIMRLCSAFLPLYSLKLYVSTTPEHSRSTSTRLSFPQADPFSGVHGTVVLPLFFVSSYESETRSV